jgi:hypothetical protein
MTAEDLIDHGLIEAAARTEAAARAKLVEASAALAAAKKRHSEAQRASERAIAGAGPLTPTAAEDDLDAAKRALRVAEKVNLAAETAVRQAVAEAETARARAHAPMLMAGARARVAAAAKADAAMASLAEAQADFVAATDLVRTARSHGCIPGQVALPDRLDHGQRLPELRTEAQERRAWEGEQFDLERGTWPWLQQFDTKGA